MDCLDRIFFITLQSIMRKLLALDALEESDIAGITVICYHSPRSKYCAMQAFAYDEFVYKGITELKIRN